MPTIDTLGVDTQKGAIMAMFDIIMKAETEGLDTEEEVVEYAIAIIDSKLYKSAGHFGRFLASLQETPLWEQVEAHYAEPEDEEPEYEGEWTNATAYEITMGLDN